MCVIYTLCASDIATLLQLWVGHPHPNGHQFKVCLLTECACSKCEPQGGEKMSAELDEKYENAWHSVAQPPRRRSGIIRELSLSMRVPTVSPANDG